jgi:dTDP-4-dehydrorhamnose reductase
MVGHALAAHCTSLGDEVLSCDHQALDITDEATVSALFARARPETVFNCAAWTDVDGCEQDPKRAFMVNARGPENLALNSRRVGATFVTISTDYVFNGAKDGFYTQRDDPNPRSVYGAAKLNGERRVQAASARTIIVRTGWIFGPGGQNFLSTVVNRVR